MPSRLVTLQRKDERRQNRSPTRQETGHELDDPGRGPAPSPSDAHLVHGVGRAAAGRLHVRLGVVQQDVLRVHDVAAGVQQAAVGQQAQEHGVVELQVVDGVHLRGERQEARRAQCSVPRVLQRSMHCVRVTYAVILQRS